MDQAGVEPFPVTVADLRRLLSPPNSGHVRGDHDLNPGMGMPSELREAAVLVAMVERPEGLTLIFTRRTAHLASHAGQISFPGGHTEAEDGSPEATALRETEEEIGLDRHHIEPIGRLDTYITRTGFLVTPVVALVRPPFVLKPDAQEVAEVFEVPLAAILAADMPQRETRTVFGARRHFYVFPWAGQSIWGATAGMLVNLRNVLGEGP